MLPFFVIFNIAVAEFRLNVGNVQKHQSLLDQWVWMCVSLWLGSGVILWAQQALCSVCSGAAKPD